MSKFDQLIQDYCPDGVEFKMIKDAYSRIKGTPITAGKMKEISKSDGDVRIFAGGKTVISAYESDIPNANITRVPAVLVQSRGVIDAVYYDKPFTFKNEMWAYTAQNSVSVKYLYYVLKDNIKHFRDAASGMGSLPQISQKVTEDFKIPIPPLEVQAEIVNILDKFTLVEAELSAELSAELEARQKQYDYYRKRLFKTDSNNRTITLADACQKITTGKLNANAKDEDGTFPFFTCDATPYRINTYAFDTEAILVSGNGSQVGHINYYKGKFNAYQRTYILSEFSTEIDVKYLLLYLNAFLRGYIFKHSKKGSVPYITLPMLQNFEIPLPGRAEQIRIAEILGAFDHLVNSISEGLPAEINARRQQYEYYRTKLLTFQELSV